MGLVADLTAYAMQRSAARSARYGDDLRFDGTATGPARRAPTRRRWPQFPSYWATRLTGTANPSGSSSPPTRCSIWNASSPLSS